MSDEHLQDGVSATKLLWKCYWRFLPEQAGALRLLGKVGCSKATWCRAAGTAEVDTPKAVRVGKGIELAAALPVAAQEPSCHPTKIWVVLRKAVSKRKIICEDILEYWLTALFQTTDKKNQKTNTQQTNESLPAIALPFKTLSLSPFRCVSIRDSSSWAEVIRREKRAGLVSHLSVKMRFTLWQV